MYLVNGFQKNFCGFHSSQKIKTNEIQEKILNDRKNLTELKSSRICSYFRFLAPNSMRNLIHCVHFVLKCELCGRHQFMETCFHAGWGQVRPGPKQGQVRSGQAGPKQGQVNWGPGPKQGQVKWGPGRPRGCEQLPTDINSIVRSRFLMYVPRVTNLENVYYW